MSDYLALDWERHRICGVVADVSGSSVRIRNSFSADIPEDANVEPERFGNWLRDELKKQNISVKDVVISLPREEVVVRHLELPQVSDAELPDLVRFQAAAKSSVPVDQLSLDFLPLPQREESAGREVLVASVHRDRMKRIHTAAAAAGLEVKSVGVSSVSTSVLVAQADESIVHAPGDVSLIITRHGDRLELSMQSSGYLHFTHSSQNSAGDDAQSRAAVLSEISRSLISQQKRLPNLRVARCWLVGSENEESELATAIRGRFECDVRRLDPFRGNRVSLACKPVEDPHSAFAGPIGQLVGKTLDENHDIDFLSPRRAEVAKDYSRHKLIAAVAAVVLVAVSLYAYRMMRVSDLKAKIAQAKRDLADQKDINEQQAPQVKVADSINEWSSQRVDWIAEAEELAATMNGTERVYLTELTFGEGSRKDRGTISAIGRAKKRFDAETLKTELSMRRNFDLNPTEVKDTGRDGDYPKQFELDIVIRKTEDSQSTKGGSAKPSR